MLPGKWALDAFSSVQSLTCGLCDSMELQHARLCVQGEPKFPDWAFIHPWACVCVWLVAQACLTLCDPMDCCLPGKDTRVGCHFLLQGIIPTQGSSQSLPCLLHCRWILYHWATGEASCPCAYPLLWGQILFGSLGVVYTLSSASYRLPSSQPLRGLKSKSGLEGAVLPPGLPGDKQEGGPGCHPTTLLLIALGEQEEELRSWFQRKKPNQKFSNRLALWVEPYTLFIKS